MTESDTERTLAALFREAAGAMPHVDAGVVVGVVERGDQVRRRRRRRTLVAAIATTAVVASGVTYAASVLPRAGQQGTVAVETQSPGPPAGFGVPAEEMAQTLASLLPGPVTNEVNGIMTDWYSRALDQTGFAGDVLARSEAQAAMVTQRQQGTSAAAAQVTVVVAHPSASTLQQRLSSLCAGKMTASLACTDVQGGRVITVAHREEEGTTSLFTRTASYVTSSGWMVQATARSERPYSLQSLTVIALNPTWLK